MFLMCLLVESVVLMAPFLDGTGILLSGVQSTINCFLGILCFRKKSDFHFVYIINFCAPPLYASVRSIIMFSMRVKNLLPERLNVRVLHSSAVCACPYFPRSGVLYIFRPCVLGLIASPRLFLDLLCFP